MPGQPMPKLPLNTFSPHDPGEGWPPDPNARVAVNQILNTSGRLDRLESAARITDRVVRWLTPVLVLVQLAELPRIIEYGGWLFYALRAILFVVIVATAFAGAQLRPSGRMLGYCGAGIVYGLSGMAQWGLYASGQAAIIVALVLGATFGIRRWLMLLILSLSGMTLIAFGWTTGWLPMSFDAGRLIRSPSAWLIATLALSAAAFASLVWEHMYRQLRESERKARAIFDSSFELIGLLTPEGRLLEINRTAVEFASAQLSEVLGRLFWETPWWSHSAEMQDRLRTAVQTAAAGAVVRFEATHPYADGSIRAVDVSVKPVEDEQGRIVLLICEGRDITDRICGEQALRDSERRLHDIIEFLPDATFAVDCDGRIIAWNRAIEEMTGVPACEMIGRGDYEYAIPFFGERRPILIDFVFKPRPEQERSYLFVQRNGDTLFAESYVCVVNGRRLHLSGKATPIRGRSGAIVGAIESIRDVTSIREAEAERRRLTSILEESEERYRSLFEAAGDAIFLMAGNHFIDCNPKTLQMFGCTREQIINAEPYRFSPGKQPDGSISEAKAKENIAAAYGGTAQFFEWRHCRADGTPFDAEVSLNRLDIGSEPHLLAIVRDITDRKEMQKQLRDAAEQWQATFDSVQDLVLVLDLDHRIVRANAAAGRFFKEIPQRLAGRCCYELMHASAKPHEMCPLAEVVRTKRHHENEIYEANRGLWLLVCVDPILDKLGNVTAIVHTVKDVTARKQAEEEVRTLNTELEQRVQNRTAQLAAANTALNEFAYVVSHDLRAPLRAVNQLAHWISEDYASVLDAAGKEKLRLMNGRITRMYSMIDGILQYSRIGRVEEDRKPTDLKAVVRDVIDALSPPAHIHVTVEGELPVIIADPTRMEQIFQNLIGNAVKFMDKPEGLITVGCEDAGDRWRFRVTDNGPGIDPKYHEKIFGIFQTLAPRDQHESTGIGLTLVKGIVELYGGKIEVASEVGKGCTFLFTLPK